MAGEDLYGGYRRPLVDTWDEALYSFLDAWREAADRGQGLGGGSATTRLHAEISEAVT